MGNTRKTEISRREFARRAALASAAPFIPPGTLSVGSALGIAPVPQAPDAAPLSPAGQVEADARYQTILKLYGSRFSDAQKNDLQRLCVSGQQALERIRAYHLENSDNPAIYLKPLVEREKKPTAATGAPTPAPVAPKS